MIKVKKDFLPPDLALYSRDIPALKASTWIKPQPDGRVHTSFSSLWSDGKRSGYKNRSFTPAEVAGIIELCVLTLLAIDHPIDESLTDYALKLKSKLQPS